jgi:hypothetical protein
MVALDREGSLTGLTVQAAKILIRPGSRVAGTGRERRGPSWSPLRVPGRAGHGLYAFRRARKGGRRGGPAPGEGRFPSCGVPNRGLGAIGCAARPACTRAGPGVARSGRPDRTPAWRLGESRFGTVGPVCLGGGTPTFRRLLLKREEFGACPCLVPRPLPVLFRAVAGSIRGSFEVRWRSSARTAGPFRAGDLSAR